MIWKSGASSVRIITVSRLLLLNLYLDLDSRGIDATVQSGVLYFPDGEPNTPLSLADSVAGTENRWWIGRGSDAQVGVWT